MTDTELLDTLTDMGIAPSVAFSVINVIKAETISPEEVATALADADKALVDLEAASAELFALRDGDDGSLEDACQQLGRAIDTLTNACRLLDAA